MSAPKGGKKLRRCARHKGMYAQQFGRTKANKIRRLRKRLDFDSSAQASINRLISQPNP